MNKFFVAEGKVSVKVIFDNVRNYLTCALICAAGTWIPSGLPKLPSYFHGPEFPKYANEISWVVLAFAAVLGLLNLLQSLEISRVIFDEVLTTVVDKLEVLDKKIGGKIGWVAFGAILMVLFVLWLLVSIFVVVSLTYALVFQAYKLYPF